MEVIDILLKLAQENAKHINILNSEMSGVLAELAIIKWFIMINVIAWLSLMVRMIGKKLFNGNKK